MSVCLYVCVHDSSMFTKTLWFTWRIQSFGFGYLQMCAFTVQHMHTYRQIWVMFNTSVGLTLAPPKCTLLQITEPKRLHASHELPSFSEHGGVVFSKYFLNNSATRIRCRRTDTAWQKGFICQCYYLYCCLPDSQVWPVCEVTGNIHPHTNG